jgi:hypothetical protein
MCSAPAASWTIPLPAAIVLTGRVAGELVSTTPSWPLSSLPQLQTEPLGAHGRGEVAPALMPAMYAGTPGHPYGDRLAGPVRVSSPSSPTLLPQVHTEVTAEMPLIRVATEANQPAEMPVTWVRPATLTGTGLSAVLPLPSWPSWPWPQANAMPSERSARPNSSQPRGVDVPAR